MLAYMSGNRIGHISVIRVRYIYVGIGTRANQFSENSL